MLASASSRDRSLLYLSFLAVLTLSALVPAISSQDPDGVVLRFGMVLMTVGAAMWLPLPVLLASVVALWIGPNVARSQVSEFELFQTEMLVELPALLALAAASLLLRRQLGVIEEKSDAFKAPVSLAWEIDPDTGLFREQLLKDSVERELVRSRRFGREFALMLAAVDEMRLKYDYRDPQKWLDGLSATAEVLLNTRTHIDRVYRYGDRGFALLLPETGVKEVAGLLRRLARAARKMSPAEGEPGGPLPLHFGATFYPQCATTVEDMIRRAEVALRIAEKSPNRIQLDGAEAPDLPPPELMRRDEDAEAEVEVLAGKWLGAEAPDEERAGVWIEAHAEMTGAHGQETAPAFAAAEFEDRSTAPGEAGPVAGLPDAEEVADMLGRLDETLRMIRELKAEATGAKAA